MKKNIIKVPLILADKNSGSGAASLAMVLSFFGINVGTDGVNGVCNTFRFGEEPDKLIFIAKGFGVESSEISPSLQDVLSLPPPAVFRMKNGEYALFRGCRNKKIYLSFPLQGEKIIPLKYFQEIFSGVCLIFKEPPGFLPTENRAPPPTSSAARSKTLRKALSLREFVRCWQYFWECAFPPDSGSFLTGSSPVRIPGFSASH